MQGRQGQGVLFADGGAAFIDVLQPCPTYNDLYTKEWYAGEDREDPKTHRAMPRIYRLEETGFDPLVKKGDRDEETAKISQAVAKAVEWADRIPVGVFYQNPFVPSFEERVEETRIPEYRLSPPARLQIAKEDGSSAAPMDALLDIFKVV